MFYKTLFISCLFISFQLASTHQKLEEQHELEEHELEVLFQFFFKVSKDGIIGKMNKTDVEVPASLDHATGVESKDVVISPETNVTARIYAHKDSNSAVQGGAPLVVYFHGGGFSTGCAASRAVHQYVNALVAKAKIVAVSVNYRLAPEHRLPIAYDDSWAALKWVESHAGRSGPDPCLNQQVDFNRVYLAGNRAGANIAHNMAMRVGMEKLDRVKLKGIILIHPFFLVEQPTPSLLAMKEYKTFNVTKLWSYLCPSCNGLSDPRINPVSDPKLATLGCKRVLVFVAEEDPLIDTGRLYCKALDRVGNSVNVFESKGKADVFHLSEPNSKEVSDMLDRVISFVNGKSLTVLDRALSPLMNTN